VIEADGELAGWLGFVEETEPEYRSVGFDISLSERFQGRSLGPDALRTVIRWFADERGHHRFTIDPNAGNERAIKAYEAVGFKRVGVMRKAELIDGEWTDGLFMELLIEELTHE
jgi:aminoglycoside 6'-N-acetyltransferase